MVANPEVIRDAGTRILTAEELEERSIISLFYLVMTQQAQHRMAPTAALDRNRSVHSLVQYFHSLVTLENLTHCGNSMLTALGIYQMLDGSP